MKGGTGEKIARANYDCDFSAAYSLYFNEP